MQAWLKNRAPGEKAIFSQLFDQNFVEVYNWGAQNVKLQMPVLQCNIVQQMLFILEGLIPTKKEDEQAVSLSSKESQDGKFNTEANLTYIAVVPIQNDSIISGQAP